MSLAWYEDVDKALMAEIKRTVKVPVRESLVNLEDRQVFVRKPEEDYKIEVYPSVSIYNLTTKFDPIRSVPYGKVNVEKNKVAGKMTYQKKPVPFKLEYQIDFWSEFQSDMNVMLQTWVLSHYRQFNLPIQGTDLTTSCNAVQTSDVHKQDEMGKEHRIFHSIISYSIWVELMDESVYNANIVKSREWAYHLNPKLKD